MVIWSGISRWDGSSEHMMDFFSRGSVGSLLVGKLAGQVFLSGSVSNGRATLFWIGNCFGWRILLGQQFDG